MADYSINAVARKVSFTGSAGVGPYAFSFEILDDDDVAVYFNETLLTKTTDYTVTVNANGTGSVTLVTGSDVPTTPDADDLIVIVGARDIERVTDFVTAGDLRASALNEQLDALTIMVQQVAEEVQRSVKAPVFDPTGINMILPKKSERVNAFIAFDANGDVSAAVPSDDVTTLAEVATDIATLADIEDGTIATDAISDTAAIASNVTTVAGIAANVTTVAGNTSNINAVAADATDIGTVAANIADVSAVAAIDSQVSAVAADATDIGTVATGIANVNTVAGIAPNVTTVAGIAPNVTTVAGISADVTAVAGDATDIGTVSTNIANVNTVAGVSANVTTVAGISGNVTTVAGIAADVSTVAADGTDIGVVAGISADVSAVAAIDSDVTIAATNVADITNFADVYQGAKASAPTLRNDGSALQTGDLYFDTVLDQMRVFDGSSFIAVGSSVNGTAQRYKYTATAAQTSFSGTDDNGVTLAYDPGYIDVYLNGVHLDPSDYTATSGTSIVLDTGAALNDELYIVAFGNFQVADTVSKADGGTFDSAVTFDAGLNTDTISEATSAAGVTIDGVLLKDNDIEATDGTFSGGVYLGGTGAANYFDDYEEGIHTATITCQTSGSITLNGTNNKLAYTKVGNLCTVHGTLVIDSVSSPNGVMRISLPFNTAQLDAAAEASWGNIIPYSAANDWFTYACYNQASVNNIIVISGSGSQWTNASIANQFSAGDEIGVFYQYRTA